MDVFSAKDIGKLGLTDEEQIRVAAANRAVIFTHDVDFLRMARREHHLGIIYVHQRSPANCRRVHKATESHS